MKHVHKRDQRVNVEIRRICNFLSLKISYCVLLIALAVISVIQILSGRVAMTFQLLVIGIIIPIIAGRLGSVRREQSQIILTMLVKKYGYTELRYKSLSNAFLIELFLLVLWQYTNQREVIDDYIISIMPIGLICIFVMTRLACYFSYRLLIKYKLKYNYL